MSITSLGLGGLEKVSIPTSSRFSSPTLPQISPRFPSMDARLVAAARLPGLSMYGTSYPSPGFPGYLPYAPAAAAVAAAAADTSAFYPALAPGENADSWRASLSQAAAAAYYDPGLAAHYGYGYGPMGLSDGARRKNATRETTSTLKAWLNEHRKNPYPTKGEKIMLAIITKMSLTQVSTWFANARRRLKKENKMTWSPRNRCGEDDDDDDITDEGHPNAENPNSRLSTPMSPDLISSGRISHPIERPQINGHSSGMDSNSDEGTSFNDVRSEVSRNLLKDNALDKNERKLSPAPGLHHQSFEENQARFSASHLSRQHSHPFDSSISSSPLTNLGSTSTLSSSIARPNIPFPQTLSQLPVVPPHPNMLHAGLAEQLGQQNSLNRLPNHLMAALIEQQLQYQQALQGLPVNSLLSTPSETSKTSSSSTSNGADALKLTSSSENITSSSPSTSKPSSPTKSKIWSIADVATGGDFSKSASKPKANEDVSGGNLLTDSSTANEIPNMRMWMNVLHHKISAGMANGLHPQQLPHLSEPPKSNSVLNHSRFTSFQTFPGLLTVPENAKAAFKETDRNIHDLAGRSSSSPQLRSSPEMKDGNSFDKLSSNNCRSSPGASSHSESSAENNEAK